MPLLTARHARKLLEIAERLYAAQDFDELVDVLLPAVAKLVCAEEADISEFDLRHKKSTHYPFPSSLWSAGAVAAWQRNMHEQPYFDYFRRTRDGTAHTMEDFLSHRQWHRLALYNEVFRPLGLDDGMGLVVEADWPMVVGLGACRAGWGFSSQERMLLNLLRPHVAQAWSNVRAFAQLRREMQAMSAALEALGCRLLELDHTGRARFLSREARALLARYFGNKAGLAQGHLPEKLRYWARQVQTREPGTNLLPQRAPLVLESEHGRLIVRLIAGSDGSRLLLKEEPKSVPATALRRLGLTERECEVLAWIAEGKTNAEIAAILGLSPLTVKRHVEDILAKLKAPNRSAAVAIASAP